MKKEKEVQVEEEEEKKALSFWGKATDFGKKAAAGVQKGAKLVSEQTKEIVHQYKVKKYKPLFPKEFKSKNFNIPNLVKIVDDAVRRDVDVCEGAIGWTDTVNGTEVLYMYDEFVPESGIEFVPFVGCDQLYYVDYFNRNRFIQVNSVFERAHSEKIAELEQIAYSLGAKSCLIELENAENDTEEYVVDNRREKKTESQFVHNKVATEHSNASEQRVLVEKETVSHNSRSGQSRIYFQGNDRLVRPELKWFANDDVIKGLIEMRLSQSNMIQSRKLILQGSTSATMSQKIACVIDQVILDDIKGKAFKTGRTNHTKHTATMAYKLHKEASSKLIFDIEF